MSKFPKYIETSLLLAGYFQVVDERIHHVIWCPATPEPYYVPTGKELRPQPVGEDAGTVTFQYYPMSAVNYVSRGYSFIIIWLD